MVSAARLKMNKEETEALVQRFIGYMREFTGVNVKPVPPFLFKISKDSREHSPEVYNEVIILGFRAMKPAPNIAITRFGAGGHSFWKAEKDLPVGIVPSVIKSWHEAITSGYFFLSSLPWTPERTKEDRRSAIIFSPNGVQSCVSEAVSTDFLSNMSALMSSFFSLDALWTQSRRQREEREHRRRTGSYLSHGLCPCSHRLRKELGEESATDLRK